MASTSDSGCEIPPAMTIVRRTLNDEYDLHFSNVDFHILCVCHIFNRAEVHSTLFIRKEVDMLHQLLKVVRGSIPNRVKFSWLAAILGVATGSIKGPGLDVEASWNSIITTSKQYLRCQVIFTALCNCEELSDRFGCSKLSDFDWHA